MGVTDKAVSKWERDLSCPDIRDAMSMPGIGLSCMAVSVIRSRG